MQLLRKKSLVNIRFTTGTDTESKNQRGIASLSLKTTTKNNKDVVLKFNIAPSKHIGFINFVNLALSQNRDITLSFEKISKTGEKEESKITGTFKFQGKGKEEDKQLQQLTEEVQDEERKHQKQLEKRK